VDVTIDHVTVAGAELDPLREAFAALGLESDYGGPHSSGGTHMALIGFDDGSYIELIAARARGQAGGLWAAQIAGDGGPCAWAARTGAIAAEAARVAALGVAVRGPEAMQRQRPDGVMVEWELAFLGTAVAGATLPFLIQDQTPREWRVRTSASVAGGPLRGVSQVILGVEAIEPAAKLFRRVYGWATPTRRDDAQLGAALAAFAGAPVTLAAPLPDASGDWLRERLARFGPAPCAYLLATSDLAGASPRAALGTPGDWFGQPVAWYPAERLRGTRLGVVANASRAH
jgi:hypothetical protein